MTRVASVTASGGAAPAGAAWPIESPKRLHRSET
jgi:hypothetical protein